MSRPVVHHIAVFCQDIEKVSSFYQAYFGFQVDRDYEAPAHLMNEIFEIDAPSRIMVLTLEELSLELFEFNGVELDQGSLKHSGINHWNVFVQDKYKTYEKIKAAGFPAIKIPRPKWDTIFVKDPEGNLIEVKSLDDN